MRLFLAAYDPVDLPGGIVAWRHSSVPAELLERFYYDILAAEVPEDRESCWAAGMFVLGRQSSTNVGAVGIVSFHAGRDRRGRPGRYIVLCLLAPRDGRIDRVPNAFPDLQVWNEIAGKIGHGLLFRPLPRSEVEVPTVPAEVHPGNLNHLLECKELRFEGPPAWNRVLALLSCIPKSHGWCCKITRRAGVLGGRFTVEERDAIRKNRAVESEQPIKAPESIRQPVVAAAVSVLTRTDADKARVRSPVKILVSSILIPAILTLGTKYWCGHAKNQFGSQTKVELNVQQNRAAERQWCDTGWATTV